MYSCPPNGSKVPGLTHDHDEGTRPADFATKANDPYDIRGRFEAPRPAHECVVFVKHEDGIEEIFRFTRERQIRARPRRVGVDRDIDGGAWDTPRCESRRFVATKRPLVEARFRIRFARCSERSTRHALELRRMSPS